MNTQQKSKCRAIIHTHATAAAAGNTAPLPGAGIAVDTAAMTSMVMCLCSVFGGNMHEEMAKGLAFATLKQTALKQPVKFVAKELSKFVPFLGQAVAPSVSFAMIEAAGWTLAHELEQKASCR